MNQSFTMSYLSVQKNPKNWLGERFCSKLQIEQWSYGQQQKEKSAVLVTKQFDKLIRYAII